MKIKKKPLNTIKEKLKIVFLANGFIRIYLEILLDGLLYILINLRSLKFLGPIDAFSYLLLAAFTCFVIFFTVFFVIYTKNTEIHKWSSKIKELLAETNEIKSGVLAYHLTFILRRVIISFNVIMLGSFNANLHISLHAIPQLFVLLFLSFYPMYENKFQKVSNLIMETGITIVFFSAYYFQNESESSILKFFVIGVIFFSQFLIMMLTISKAIKDMVIKYQNSKGKIMGTKKGIDQKIYDKSIFDMTRKSEILHTKSPVMKTIEE